MPALLAEIQQSEHNNEPVFDLLGILVLVAILTDVGRHFGVPDGVFGSTANVAAVEHPVDAVNLLETENCKVLDLHATSLDEIFHVVLAIGVRFEHFSLVEHLRDG